jgi:hypothetical protein
VARGRTQYCAAVSILYFDIFRRVVAWHFEFSCVLSLFPCSMVAVYDVNLLGAIAWRLESYNFVGPMVEARSQGAVLNQR